MYRFLADLVYNHTQTASESRLYCVSGTRHAPKLLFRPRRLLMGVGFCL